MFRARYLYTIHNNQGGNCNYDIYITTNQISIAGTVPGPGGDTMFKKLLAGDVARTATLKAT